MRALDLKGLPLGEAPLRLQGRRPRDRRRARPAGRDPQRHRAARDRRRALGRRRAAARQALAPPHRRRRLRRDRRHRAAAARLDLLSVARARPVRRRAARRARLAGRGGAPLRRAERADDHPGRCRQRRRRGARPARPTGSRTAACWCASPARGSPAADDDLVPVQLRRGGRILGGSLCWEKPQHARRASRAKARSAAWRCRTTSRVTRQVLAEPEAGLAERTWATLADGTPLVTAEQRGKGMIVLFHVTADTRWSDLPLSGAFVDMLRRIVGLAGTDAPTDDEPTQGRTRARWCRRPASSTASARSARRRRPRGRCRSDYVGRATADHPPGFYGPPEGLLAVNTLAPADRLAGLDFAPLNARLEAYQLGEPQDLRGPVLLGGAGAARCSTRWSCSGSPAARAGLRAAPRRAGRDRCSRVVLRRLSLASAGARAARKPRRSRRAAAATPARRRRDDFAMKATRRDAARLCRHRRRRGRRRQQGRPAGPHAVPRAAHRARSRRAGRPRHRARRARVLPADLLADRARRGRSRRRRRSRRIDAYMKHGGTVLFDTRDAIDGAARPRRRQPQRPACWRCATSCRRSTFPSSSRCRATTC